MIITCVHQSSELYGSDRSFADAVQALRDARPQDEIDVILPSAGPLTALLHKAGVRLTFERVWIPRKVRGVRLMADLPRLPMAVARACARIRRSGVTYVNTVVVIDYILASYLMRRHKVIVHIREIPPARFLPIFRTLLRMSGATLVYNSEATKAAYGIGDAREHVVYNGFAEIAEIAPPHPERRPLRLLLIGRINSWKGQDLLVEALARFGPEDRRRLDVRIVGDTYEGGEHILHLLNDLVRTHDLGSIVRVEGFVADPSALYRWADIVVVPSRQPEPFGRVAIEGMAYSRPILGSAHGGLSEIVVHRETGWLFAPNDAEALADAIADALADPAMVERAGRMARRRFVQNFTLPQTQAALMGVFNGVLGYAARAPSLDRSNVSI